VRGNGSALLHRRELPQLPAGSTWCHACGQLLIARDWYQLGASNAIEDGCCRHCGTRCAGRFDGLPEG
jgi:pyruvate formate lyase activating enzyme